MLKQMELAPAKLTLLDQCVTNVRWDIVAQIVTNVMKGTINIKNLALLVNVALEGLKCKKLMEPVNAKRGLVEIHVIIVGLDFTCIIMNA